jgi:hypothetical protein
MLLGVGQILLIQEPLWDTCLPVTQVILDQANWRRATSLACYCKLRTFADNFKSENYLDHGRIRRCNKCEVSGIHCRLIIVECSGVRTSHVLVKRKADVIHRLCALTSVARCGRMLWISFNKNVARRCKNVRQRSNSHVVDFSPFIEYSSLTHHNLIEALNQDLR